MRLEANEGQSASGAEAGKTEERPTMSADNEDSFHDRMLSLGLARVSEAAAIASSRLIGRGDEKAADAAAVEAMRIQLNMLDIQGTVVIGEGERDEAPMLFIGEEVGHWQHTHQRVGIAVDPLEGTNLCAGGAPGGARTISLRWAFHLAPGSTSIRGKLEIAFTIHRSWRRSGFATGALDPSCSPGSPVTAPGRRSPLNWPQWAMGGEPTTWR